MSLEPKSKSEKLTSTHWGQCRAKLVDGKLTDLQGVETNDAPSPFSGNMLNTLSASNRIAQPMIRRGLLEDRERSDTSLRGSDTFVPVSWDVAEQLVAEELKRVRRDYGNQAIYGGSYGWASAGRFHHAQSRIHCFLNTIGGYTASVDTYSFASAQVMLPHVIGIDIFR